MKERERFARARDETAHKEGAIALAKYMGFSLVATPDGKKQSISVVDPEGKLPWEKMLAPPMLSTPHNRRVYLGPWCKWRAAHFALLSVLAYHTF